MSQQNIPQKFFLCLPVFRRKKNFNEQISDTLGGKKTNNFLTWFRLPMFTSFDMFTFDSPTASFRFYRNDLSILNGSGRWQQRQITWWKLVTLFTKVLKQLGTFSLRAGNKINGILANYWYLFSYFYDGQPLLLSLAPWKIRCLSSIGQFETFWSSPPIWVTIERQLTILIALSH